jgi:hypothetical protein
MYILTFSKLQFLLLNIVIIIIFALVYKKYGNENHFIFLNEHQTEMDFTDALYFSVNTYTTVGNNDIHAKTKFMKNIIMLQLFTLLMITILIIFRFDKKNKKN